MSALDSKMLYEAISKRVSTRSYDGQPLDTGLRAALETLLAELGQKHGPFGHKLRFALAAADAGSARMGTYGFISGASAYLVAAVARGPGAMEDFGYLVEKAVLGATAAGIDTCWIGGLFSRGKATQAIGARDDEIVPAVIALGRASSRRSLLDTIVTTSARARTRRPLESMLRYEGDPLGSDLPSALRQALEALRIGPSASNKQPWRIVLSPGGMQPGAWRITLCLDEDKIYNSALGEAKMQNIDMGIAMAHFEIAAAALGLPGSWNPVPDQSSVLTHTEGWIPIADWE